MLFADPQLRYASPFSQRKIQGLVKKICKAAGFRVRNPHDLRHTYATLLLMSHMSPGYVQKQLGHSSISITMDIYCHWISTQGRQGLEEAFGEQSVVPNRVRPPHIIAYKAKRSQ
jgi:integrase